LFDFFDRGQISTMAAAPDMAELADDMIYAARAADMEEFEAGKTHFRNHSLTITSLTLYYFLQLLAQGHPLIPVMKITRHHL